MPAGPKKIKARNGTRAPRRRKPKSRETLLAELERLISACQPADYGKFMTTYEGKFGDGRLLSFKVGRDDSAPLAELWPLRGRHYSVAGGWGLLTGDESHLLVIGEDGMGDWVALAVHGPDAGKVFFVDHEREPGERRRLVKVGESFASFMKGLRPS